MLIDWLLCFKKTMFFTKTGLISSYLSEYSIIESTLTYTAHRMLFLFACNLVNGTLECHTSAHKSHAYPIKPKKDATRYKTNIYAVDISNWSSGIVFSLCRWNIITVIHKIIRWRLYFHLEIIIIRKTSIRYTNYLNIQLTGTKPCGYFEKKKWVKSWLCLTMNSTCTIDQGILIQTNGTFL